MQLMLRRNFGNPVRRLQMALGALTLLTAFGTLGFAWLGDAELVDALLMTVITISTVGYRESVPLDTVSLKLFASGLILSAVLVTAWAVSSIAELVFAEYLWTFVGRRRMQARIDEMSGHTIICGYGRMGRAVINELQADGTTTVAIEMDEHRIQWILDAGHAFVGGDATHDETLIAAGIERAESLIAVTATDAVNLMIVLSARALNPNLRISSRASDPDAIDKLYRAGSNYVLHPHGTGAMHLALSITNPVVEDALNHLIPRAGELDFGQLHVESDGELVGRPLADIKIRKLEALVIAIQRDDELMLPARADVPLEDGDVLVVAGSSGSLRRLARLAAGEDWRESTKL